MHRESSTHLVEHCVQSNLIISTLRQIPDTQEVLLSPNSDITFIVEILESVEPKDMTEAIKFVRLLMILSHQSTYTIRFRFHFHSVAHDNDAQSQSVVEILHLPPNSTAPSSTKRTPQPAPYILQGTQAVPKFNRAQADQVTIFLALFRVEGKEIDIVMCCNAPTRSDNPEVKVASEAEVQELKKIFQQAVSKFRIVDFSLFL
jgi:hypothetical protein